MAECVALPKGFAAAAGVAAVGVLLLGWAPAVAQTGQPRQAEPNVIERIGDWFGRFKRDMKQTFAGVERFGDRSRDAVKRAAADGAVSATLPPPRIISERRRCNPAANGAPDCKRAAEAACRGRGYATGRSLQTQSERKCALPRLFSEAPVKCHTEAHILRAICR